MKNGIQGVIFMGVASAILGWISWGLGLIPMSKTVFDPSLLLAQVLGLVIVVPLLAALLHTNPKDTPEMDSGILGRLLEQEEANRKPKMR